MYNFGAAAAAVHTKKMSIFSGMCAWSSFCVCPMHLSSLPVKVVSSADKLEQVFFKPLTVVFRQIINDVCKINQ